MPAGRKPDAGAAVELLEVGVGDGAEAAVAGVAPPRPLGEREAPAPGAGAEGGGAQRVASQGGHGGRLRALAADVSHHDRPAPAAGLEQVVEVATHLAAVAGVTEADGCLDARDLGEVHGQEALLQGARYVGTLAVETVVVERGRAAPGQLMRHLDVVLVVTAARWAGGERERAERAVAGRQRHDHRRAHPERAEQAALLLAAGEALQQLVA